MAFLFKKTKSDRPADNTSRRPLRTGQAPVQPGRHPVRRTANRQDQSYSKPFSYYANRSQSELNTGRETWADKPVPRRTPGRLQKLKAHWTMIAGGVLLLAVVIYQLQLSSTPNVVSLVAASDAPFLRDTKIYQQAATKLIDNSTTNRNKLTIDTSGIAASLRQQFPELETVTVTLPLLGDRANIYVKPADPALVLATANETFVIDERGRALSEARSQAQLTRLQIPTVTDQSNLAFKLGSQALSRQTTAFIQTVARQHRAHKIDVRAMTLPPAASELDVYITGKPYFIKYNIHDGDAEAASLQTGSYIATSRHLAAKNITPAQYIDVRLQGRVYYK